MKEETRKEIRDKDKNFFIKLDKVLNDNYGWEASTPQEINLKKSLEKFVDQIQIATEKAVIEEIEKALEGAHKFHSPHAIKEFLSKLKEIRE